VGGYYNRQLTSLAGGYGSAHFDVHLWYHGTVNLDTPFTADKVTVGINQRDTWWAAPETQGAATGFYLGRIGGGDRFSTERPLGGSTDRINDGLNKRWDFGAGVDPNRVALPSNSGLWPNVIRCSLPAGQVAAGESFALDLHHQSGASATGDSELSIFLDFDCNPWNGNEIELARSALARTSPATVTQSNFAIPVSAAVPPGTYAVLSKITDGNHSRSCYAATGLEVVLPPIIDQDTLRLEGGLITFTIVAMAGQTITLLASENLIDWEPIATMPLTANTWEFTDPDSASHRRRFYFPVLEP
jgi:hypothetical protein